MVAVGCRGHAGIENPQPTGGQRRPGRRVSLRQPEPRKLRSEQELGMAQTAKLRPPGTHLKAPGFKPWVSNPGMGSCFRTPTRFALTSARRALLELLQ